MNKHGFGLRRRAVDVHEDESGLTRTNKRELELERGRLETA